MSNPRGTMRFVTLALIAILVGACGESGSVETEPPGLVSNPGEVALQAQCGPLRIPVGEPAENGISVSLPNEPLNPDAGRALGDIQQDSAPETDLFDDYTWTMADVTDDEIALFGRGAGAGEYGYAYADLVDDEWRIQRYGGCQLRVAADGYGAAIWALDAEPDPVQSAISVVINERECANGEGPVGRDIVPVVLDDEQQITIVILVEPVSGNATCLSNPWHPIVIDLGSPIGGRQLFDGGLVPPRLQEWPPSQEYLDTLGQSG